jgi:hypothetical protein
MAAICKSSTDAQVSFPPTGWLLLPPLCGAIIVWCALLHLFILASPFTFSSPQSKRCDKINPSNGDELNWQCLC